MAFQFVYRHGPSGYEIHGINDRALKQLVLEQLESDRVDPHLLERSPVWRWMRIGPEHWCVTDSSLRTAPTGRQALEVRGVVLNAADGEAIRWNPFLLAGVFSDDGMWQHKQLDSSSEGNLRSWLHRSSPCNKDVAQGGQDGRKWQVVTSDTADLARGMDLFSTDKRKQIEITATIDPEGLCHQLFAHSYDTTKAKATDTSKGPSKVMLGMFVALCAMGVIAGIWMWSLSSDRNSLEAAVNERDQLLLSQEAELDNIREERDLLRRQYAGDREAISRQLIQLATSTARAEELRGSIVDDVHRRRGYIQHYLDQVMLQEALEEWIDLERAYGVADQRIRAIEKSVSALRSQQQELNNELMRLQRMTAVDERARQRLDRVAERVEQAAGELLRILQATDDEPSGDSRLRQEQ